MKTIFDSGKIEVNEIEENGKKVIEVQLWDGYSLDPVNDTLTKSQVINLIYALQKWIGEGDSIEILD